MDDVPPVQTAEREQRLMRDFQGKREARKTGELQELGHIDAVDELQNDIRRPFCILEKIKDRADVGVLEQRQCLRFLQKAASLLVARSALSVHDLDDADFVQVQVADLVDSSGLALLDRVEDLVLSFNERARLRQGRVSFEGLEDSTPATNARHRRRALAHSAHPQQFGWSSVPRTLGNWRSGQFSPPTRSLCDGLCLRPGRFADFLSRRSRDATLKIGARSSRLRSQLLDSVILASQKRSASLDTLGVLP